jgi:hypothetical protein
LTEYLNFSWASSFPSAIDLQVVHRFPTIAGISEWTHRRKRLPYAFTSAEFTTSVSFTPR